MRFVLASYGTRGDIEPLVAVGRELLRRGHEVRMAVPPDLIAFAEAAGPTAIAYGPDLQAVLDAHRNFWTHFFRNFWKVREMIRLRREVTEPFFQAWKDIVATLTSLAEGADLLFTGVNFEDAAGNVAEYYDIPLATLHLFPLRANGQFLPVRPARLGRAAMKVSAVSFACRRQPGPRRGGSPNADAWKSKRTTRFASPGWPKNGRNGLTNDPSWAP
jgi:UDP:flavonoid glycosyltransferase YjiC (YdhE family)